MDDQIAKQIQKLMAIDLVERTQVLNRQGRGYAWHLSIKDTAQTRKLVRAIERRSSDGFPSPERERGRGEGPLFPQMAR